MEPNFRQHFQDRIDDLREAMWSYDSASKLDFATRRRKSQWIAIVISLLVLKNGQRDTPLLERLGLSNRVVIPLSGNHDKVDIHNIGDLVSPLKLNISTEVATRSVIAEADLGCLDFAPKLPVQQWLDSRILPAHRNSLRRRELINIVRSQDGIAHVDGRINNAKYTTLRANGVPRIMYHETNKGIDLSIEKEDRNKVTFHFFSERPRRDEPTPSPTSEELPVLGVVESLLRIMAAEIDWTIRAESLL